MTKESYEKNITFESKDFQYLRSYFFKVPSFKKEDGKKTKKIEFKAFQNKSLGFVVLETGQEIYNEYFPNIKVYSYLLGEIYEEEVFFYSNLGNNFTNKSLNEPDTLIELDKNKDYFCNAFYEALKNIDWKKDKGSWAKFIRENRKIYEKLLIKVSLSYQDKENTLSKLDVLNLVESIQEKDKLSKEEIIEFTEKIKKFLNFC